MHSASATLDHTNNAGYRNAILVATMVMEKGKHVRAGAYGKVKDGCIAGLNQQGGYP